MIVWLPRLNPDVLKETVPPLPSAFCARTVLPSRKVTIPVGTAAPGGIVFTVAVNVTVWPAPEGFGLAARVLVEPYAWMFCTNVMLPTLKLASPL